MRRTCISMASESPRLLRVLTSPVVITAVLWAGGAKAEEYDTLNQRARDILARFDTAEEDVDRRVLDWLASSEEKAQSTGDLDTVLAIRESRSAYEQSRTIPDGAPSRVRRKREEARKRLSRQADQLIRELTQLDYIDRAIELRAEVNDALSGARRVTWVKAIDQGEVSKDVSLGRFYVKGSTLTANGNDDKLLFCMKKLKNFRARVTYRVTDDCEAALIFRCPNARQPREVGYSVGLGSSKGWIYNINKAFRFVHKSTRTKRIVDRNDDPNRAVTTAGEWHTVEVIADGDQFVTLLDGKILHDFQDATHKEGAIGIQSRRGVLEIKTLEYAELPDDRQTDDD